ncbi:MAG: protein kinase [Planctomycetota bacterium]
MRDGGCAAIAAPVVFLSAPDNDRPDTSVFSAKDSTLSATDNPNKPASGSVWMFDDYEINREISRGSMGVVYQARQASLNRTVALKVLRAGEIAPDQLVERFKREARALAGLSHPAIVPLYETGSDGDAHFFSMAFIDGRTLKDIIATERLPIRRALEIVWEVADALAAAHERDVIHRDVKPSNIMIDKSGRVHLMDFGLAKHSVEQEGQTRSGTMIGTPSYMPPEQARGDSKYVDARADVYSLGAVLYELICGQPPFTASSALEIILKAINEDLVPLKKRRTDIHPDIQTIAMKALAKRPFERYSTMREMRDDIRRFLDGQAIRAKPPTVIHQTGRWLRKNASRITIVLLLIALATTTSLLIQRHYERQAFETGRASEWVIFSSQTRDGEPIGSEPPGWRVRPVQKAYQPLTSSPSSPNLELASSLRFWIDGEFSVQFRPVKPLSACDLAVGLVASQHDDADQTPWLVRINGGQFELIGPAENHPQRDEPPTLLRARALPDDWLSDTTNDYQLTVRREGLKISATLARLDGAGGTLTLEHSGIALTNWLFKYLRAVIRPASVKDDPKTLIIRELTMKRKTMPSRPSQMLLASQTLYSGEYEGAISQLRAIIDDAPGAQAGGIDAATARFLTGIAYEAQGDWALAADQYQFLRQALLTDLAVNHTPPEFFPASARLAPRFDPPQRLKDSLDIRTTTAPFADDRLRLLSASSARCLVAETERARTGEASAMIGDCYHFGGPGAFAFDYIRTGGVWLNRNNDPRISEAVWHSLSSTEKMSAPSAAALKSELLGRFVREKDEISVQRMNGTGGAIR